MSFSRHLGSIRNVVISFLLMISCVNPVIAENPVTVIYPVYHTDTDRIIVEIREGIRSQQAGNIEEVAYDPLRDSKELRDKIAALSDKDIVITLTNEMERLVRVSGFSGQLIDGVSVDLTKKESTVNIGIQPSPYTYVEILKKLSPQVKKLFYFSPLSGDTLKKGDSFQASGNNHIDIHYISVDSINAAMHEVNDVLSHADPTTTAVWLPSRVLSMSNNTVLRYVLQEAWKRSFIVFTDSLDAVLRGLLFTLVPDYHAYGKYLGQKATDIASGETYPVSKSIRYFNDVYLMINQRFAIHLGVNPNHSVFDKYRIVVPAK